MCNFWACILTKDMKVVWDKGATSHEELIKKAGLKDDELKDRKFVRIEITPKNIFSKKRSDWNYAVDEEGTLPLWYSAAEKKCESVVWKGWEQAMKQTLWKLELEKTEKFVDEIKKIKYLDFHGEIKKEWHVSVGANLAAAGAAARAAAGAAARAAAGAAARDAAGAAARDAARDAAGAAARDAAGAAAGAAAGDAARDVARDAARDAAWDVARDAARAAAWDVARDAAGDAARDAAGILAGAKLEAKHRLHLEARMDVWRAGFGLYCDVNGKLFVYAVKKENSK